MSRTPDRPDATDHVYTFGDFILNARRRLLLARATEDVLAGGTAVQVLLMLVAHRPRLVTKDELLQTVWSDRFVDDNALSQAISTLRRVCGEQPVDPQFIATVHRRGYRFIAPVTEVHQPLQCPFCASRPPHDRPRVKDSNIANAGPDRCFASAVWSDTSPHFGCCTGTAFPVYHLQRLDARQELVRLQGLPGEPALFPDVASRRHILSQTLPTAAGAVQEPREERVKEPGRPRIRSAR